MNRDCKNALIEVQHKTKDSSTFNRKNYITPNPESVLNNIDSVPIDVDKDYYIRWAEAKKDINKIKNSNHTIKFDFKLNPYPHQHNAIRFILQTPAQALFAEPGTGKTFCALVSAEIRKKLGRVDKILVVCPASIMETGWVEDCLKFTNLRPIVVANQYYYTCTTCNRKKSCKCEVKNDLSDWNKYSTVEEKLNADYDIYITSYETLNIHKSFFLEKKFDMVIADESTMFKNPRSKRAEVLVKIGHQAKYRLALTGTPITGEVLDIYPQMCFVDYSLGAFIKDFEGKYYFNPPNSPSYMKVQLKGSEEDVMNRIKDSVLVIKKDECLSLPQRITKTLNVKPTNKTKKVYKEFAKELFVRDEGEYVIAHNVLTELLRLHQIINGFWTQDDGTTHIVEKNPAKIKECKHIVSQAPDKVIIWAVYKQDFRNLLKAFPDAAVLNGNTKDVKQEVNKFKNESKVMIAHPKSAKYGHTWNWASTSIFYSYGYSVEDYWQARDRNYRIGQDKKTVEYILNSGGIESKILKAIKKKEDFSKGAMGLLDDIKNLLL